MHWFYQFETSVFFFWLIPFTFRSLPKVTFRNCFIIYFTSKIYWIITSTRGHNLFPQIILKMLILWHQPQWLHLTRKKKKLFHVIKQSTAAQLWYALFSFLSFYCILFSYATMLEKKWSCVGVRPEQVNTSQPIQYTVTAYFKVFSYTG